MEVLQYRDHAITCLVVKEAMGKPNMRWNCHISIGRGSAQPVTHYRLSVSAWTASTAKTLGLECAMQHIDEVLDVAFDPKKP
ncbi:hypothetical protein [Pseudoduganella sp. RAF53_2]|uniref:hypothetical protein n=1 Tax=unclassified Pseudoduganella TaxID=2637179 RepID=UPI003F9A1C99